MMKKLFNLVIGMMLLCSMGAFAKLIVECEPQSGTVVKGYSQTATQKVTVYATSNGEQVSTLSLLFTLPAGLAVEDGQTEGDTDSVTFTDAIIAANAIVGATVFDGELEIVIAPSIGASIAKLDVMNLPSGVRTALCDIVFTIDLDATTETTLTSQISVEECTTYTDDVESVTDNLKLSFNLLRDTYSFAKKDGATVELDEDGAAVTIAATDTNLFTAQLWDVDKEALVDTDAVEFTAAVASDEAAGTVALEGGKFVYTPAENYNGNFTINYTATFTGIADANVDGSIDVTVNAVNDAPAIAIVEPVAVNEGEALTFAMSFSDVDTAWDAFTKTVTLNGNVIAGEWTAGETEGVYTFTASEIANYDIVAHPAKTATSALVVTIDDQAGEDGSVGTAEAEVTINDVDQATDFGATAIAVVATPDPAVFGSKLTAVLDNKITDPDENDTPVFSYQWYRGEEAVAGETALALKTAVKKGDIWKIKAIATVKPYGDEIAAQEEFTSDPIEIGNTAPTTEDAALFIRKTDAAEATDAADITMADVDGDNLEIVIKTQGTKGTAVAEGNTIKYTVTDTTTEFFDADADVVTFVVNDGKDDSEEHTLTVTYRANPPAEIIVTTDAPETVDEVDDKGDAVSFEIAISTTDSDEVTPNGIANIVWTADEGLILETPATEGIGTDAATSSVVVKTNGYATLDGAERPASQDFTIKATVTDALGATTVETFKVTVNDVDRTVPATFTVAFNPAEPKTQDDLTAAIDGAAEDPDGDAITGYKFVWTVNGVEVAEDGNVLAANNFKKGDTVAVKAAALTKPYDADEVENDMMEEAVSVVIGNTAPTLDLVEGVKLEATEDQAAVEYALNGFVAAADPDALVGVDTLVFAVTPNFGDEVGTLSYDAETGKVTFKPALNYNDNFANGELPTFSVTVTDGEVTTDPVNVEITVAAVNDAPTATVADVYIQPDQAGQEITVTFAVAAGPEDESAQQIDLESCDYTAPEDGKVLLNGYAAVVDNDAKTITFTFNVAEDAEIGAEGKIKFVIKDDADAASEYSFKIVLSGTPWYPTVILPCEDDVEGVVVRMMVNGEPTDLVVKERNVDGQFVLTPAAYYNSGFKGFNRNAQSDIAVYHWSAKGGTGDHCVDVEDGINVPDYQAPGKAAVTGTGTDNQNNVIIVTAPLASGFELTVTDENGNVVANVAQDFVPGEDGQMETSATVTLAGLETGKKYTVVARGVNPMKEYGDESDAFELTIDEPKAWPGDGEFFPPQNWTTTIATNSTDITFKWPVNAKADTYTLRIFDGEGNEQSVHTKVLVNSINVTGIPAGNYRWYVETSNGETSDMMLFTVTKVTGGNPVITGGEGDGNKLTLYAENLVAGDYKYDVIYFDMHYNQWAYQLFTGTAYPDEGYLELTGKDVTFFKRKDDDSANYIMIRPWIDKDHADVNGKYQTLLINDYK